MAARTNGASQATQALTGELTYYTAYTTSDIDITVTGRIQDQSQKSFEVLVQAIGLRAMPVILNNPKFVTELSDHGASQLSGPGYIWKFATEQADIFKIGNDPVGLLTQELKGIVMPTATIIETEGVNQNTEFQSSTF
jgi:hypothetical protein